MEEAPSSVGCLSSIYGQTRTMYALLLYCTGYVQAVAGGERGKGKRAVYYLSPFGVSEG